MASSNYPAIIAALVKQLQSVKSLKAVLDYEPASLSGAPLLYVVLDRGRLGDTLMNGAMEFHYDVRLRCVLPYTNNHKVEQQVAAILPQIVAALGASVTLNGAIQGGSLDLE